MLIVNPLYDHAFKYLMSNNRYAKRILEIILQEEIVELTLSSQETVVPDEKRFLTLFRLDFKAVIKAPDGTEKVVLIELQKSKFETDIHRFRNYLGTNYISSAYTDASSESEETHVKAIYPIVTIYILGYNLSDLLYLAVQAKPKLINAVDGQKIEANSFFVNHLTHKSFVIQIRRLPAHRRTSLERFLTFFNQAWIADKNYLLDLAEVPEEFAEIASYLERPILDADFRKRLEAEEELDIIFNNQEAKYLKQIADAKEEAKQAQLREEEAKLREEEALLLAEKERSEKLESQKRETEAIHKAEEAQNRIKQTAQKLKSIGQSAAEIAEILGLSIAEIDNLLS